MQFTELVSIFFSPTGTTKKIIDTIISSFDIANHQQIDLTPPTNSCNKTLDPNQLTIIGMPIYRGCLPEEGIKRLKNIKGNNTPAITFVTYGNCNIGTALVELQEIAKKQGFSPIAGGTFIGEHSFSSEKFPIAANRPDHSDLEFTTQKTQALAKQLATIKEFSFHVKESALEITRKETLRIPPHFDSALCTHCGQCQQICPTASIINQISSPETCITCMSCVKQCSSKARSIQNPKLLEMIKTLHDNYSVRKEPTFDFYI